MHIPGAMKIAGALDMHMAPVTMQHHGRTAISLNHIGYVLYPTGLIA
jgi:hypothetical protein